MSATSDVELQGGSRTGLEARNQGVARDDVMRAIRQEPAWRALPLGQWAMRAAPQDIGVGALFAARLAGRGAGNLASACMATMRDRVKACASQMNHGELHVVDQELSRAQEAFARGTHARCVTGEVRGVIARSMKRLEGVRGWESIHQQVQWFGGMCEWYVCEDGSVLGVQEDGLIWGLEGDVQAAREAAQGMMSACTAGGFIKPILIAGLHNPWLLVEALRATSKGNNGYTPRVYVYEPDARVVALAMAHREIEEAAGAARVCWAVGPKAHEDLRGDFEAHRLWALPECVYAQPRVVGNLELGTVCARVLEEGKRAQQMDVKSKHENVVLASQKREAGRAKREGPVCDGAMDVAWNGVRVLVLTSRYTTFLKHSAGDLANSLMRKGASVKVLMEPDDHSLLGAGAYLDVIERHEPEVIFTINYPRAHLGDIVPKDVPLVCWVQDAMPHLFDSAAGAGTGNRDLVVGHLYPELFEKFGYSQERAIPAAVVADEVKFHAGPVGPGVLEAQGCEVAMVSHHSETPSDMHARLVSSARVAPAIAQVMERIYSKLNEVVAQAAEVAPVRAVEGLILESMREVLGNDGDVKSRSLLLRTYAMPLADRMLRHETLGWLEEMVARRGWRMRLYGKGWEQHPTLHTYAAGELEHGEALRAAYQGAKVHLHVSLHSLVHQRVLECYLSGGMCLVRWHRDALAGLKTTAHLKLSMMEPDASTLREVTGPGTQGGVVKEHVGYLISKHEAAEVLAKQYAALGQPIEGEMLWIPRSRLSNLAAMGPRVNTQTDLGGLLGDDFGNGVFRTAAELENRIERVLAQDSADPLGRAAHIERVRQRVISGYTFNALLGRVHQAVFAGASQNTIAGTKIQQGRGV